MRLLRLLSGRFIAKRLPNIIAYIITKALKYVGKNYPVKYAKVVETINDLTNALNYTKEVASDGIVTKAEYEEVKKRYMEIFK